ncbi:MAG: hypothetical protein ACR2NN_01080 [Bryobacteraceae bacterium]
MKLVALLVVATLAYAQPKPNFSGTWKQDNAKSNFANLPVPISVTDVITHKEPSLHLTQTIVGPQGDSVTSEHDYATDGREQTGKSRNYTEKNTVQWEGNSLVFTNKRDYNGREVLIREVWILSPHGKTLTKERFTPGAKGEVKQTFVLEKQ